jgi:hypothetical protein
VVCRRILGVSEEAWTIGPEPAEKRRKKGLSCVRQDVRKLTQLLHSALTGCDALALDVDDTIWASVMVANDNPVIDPAGHLIGNLSGRPFSQPWGQILARTKSRSAFYETNAGTGSVVRINVGKKFTFDVIATGFPVNHGKPGTALAPSGLAYDARIDTLYFADGMNNTIVAFKNVSRIRRDGIKAVDNGMKFAGASASDARVVFAGAPLNGPISTALLPNGNLVVGNTLDPNGKNLLIEISATGKLLDVRNVDKGAAGALFGIAVTGSKISDTRVYFLTTTTTTTCRSSRLSRDRDSSSTSQPQNQSLVKVATTLGSHVLPLSAEKDWVNRHDRAVMSSNT